jgi:putative transcriptional regulator
MPIKVKLIEILEQKGISQRELARMTGLRPNTVNHLCSGEVDRVYLETLEKVCKALDVKIEDILQLE